MQLETIQNFSAFDRATETSEIKEDSGIIIVEPAVKTLACGEIGAGALAELDDIIRAVNKCLVKRESGFLTSSRNSDVSNVEKA